VSAEPVVVVVFDLGAASPVEVARSAVDRCRPVFVADRDTQGGGLTPVMASLAPTVDATGRDDGDVAEELLRLAPAGITTFSEHQIRRTASLAARLGLPYHTPEVAERLTDKWAQREAVRAAGADRVRSRLLTGPADLPAALEDVPLPGIIKPVQGAGSRDTYRVDDAAACAAVVESLFAAAPGRRFVLEEMLVGDPSAAGPDWGDYVSVETLWVDGAAHHLTVTGRFRLAPPFRETGAFLPAEVPPDLWAAAERLTERASAAIGVRDGFTHTEIKLTRDGPRLLEVNGRLGGHLSQMLRRALDLDPVALALQTAAGTVTPPAEITFRCISFDYFPAAPMEARRLVAVEGIDEVRRLPGVERVTLRLQPGTDLDWRAGSEAYVCLVSGAVATHDELRRTIAGVDATLRPTFELG
jgi:biotin carboxylase